METSESSVLGSFKSKKVLRSISKASASDQSAKPSIQSPMSSKTPAKYAEPSRRAQNCNAALSVKDIRQMAQKLPKADPDRSTPQDPAADLQTRHSTPMVSVKKKATKSIKLPEKYEMLDEFFNSLDSSIRLLRLKKSVPIFTNIRPQIECLTDRRITYSHLAQMKFIFPEAIEIKKTLVRDEQTSCMKPDLHITLNTNAVEYEEVLKSENASIQLRKMFRVRLMDFFKDTDSQEDEIPMEMLPEPFNRPMQEQKNTIAMTKPSLQHATSNDVLAEHQPAIASHLSQSFRKRFFKQLSSQEAEKPNQESLIPSPQTSHHKFSKLCVEQSSSQGDSCIHTALSPNKTSLEPTTTERSLTYSASPARPPLSHPLATPVKDIASANDAHSSIGTTTVQGTPAKLIYTPARLMTSTPTLQPPKRSFLSPENDSIYSREKLVRRAPASRPLKFESPVKTAGLKKNASGTLSAEREILDSLPENLLQSIREKERKILEEQDPAISQAKWRRQMIANLPKLFDMIHLLFQSIRGSVILKEELVQKIVSSHLDMIDRREAEEQIRLLQELVPEWIHEKSASSGDVLLCINKISSPKSIRARLTEAM